MTREATADNLTDEQVRDELAILPAGHHAIQWCLDALALASPSHPHRRNNARRLIAELINARAKGGAR